jgi:hypothetical protein
MPNPNQIQALNLLRRLRADPACEDARKAAQAIVEKVQGVALALTAQAVLQTAIASYPDESIRDALKRLGEEVDHSRRQDRQLQAFFADAIKSEEQRLAPFDAACTTRLAQIQDAIDEAHRDHRSKILGQDREERRWRVYANRGLSIEEIKALGINPPNYDRDLIAERNAWAIELKQNTQALTTERDAIHRFKHTRNENALPQSVLALVEGAKVQA